MRDRVRAARWHACVAVLAHIGKAFAVGGTASRIRRVVARAAALARATPHDPPPDRASDPTTVDHVFGRLVVGALGRARGVDGGERATSGRGRAENEPHARGDPRPPTRTSRLDDCLTRVHLSGHSTRRRARGSHQWRRRGTGRHALRPAPTRSRPLAPGTALAASITWMRPGGVRLALFAVAGCGARAAERDFAFDAGGGMESEGEPAESESEAGPTGSPGS